MKKGFRNTDLEGTGTVDVLSGRDDKVKGQDMGMLSGNRAATLLNDAQTLDLNRTRSQHLICWAEGSTPGVYNLRRVHKLGLIVCAHPVSFARRPR